MRVAIFGTGGVGGYFGGRLAEAGEEVVFIARGEHLQALRTRGLRVESLKGDFVVQPVQATDDPGQVGVVDAVLVGVKAWQESEAAQAIRPMVGPASFVVPLQNGVEAPGQLAAVLGTRYVLGGLCSIISFIAGSVHIHHTGAEPFWSGTTKLAGPTIGRMGGGWQRRERRSSSLPVGSICRLFAPAACGSRA